MIFKQFELIHIRFVKGSLYIKMQNVVMLKVERVRSECEKTDKCKMGYVHWGILMGEMRSIVDMLTMYGIDPHPDLNYPNEKDFDRVVKNNVSQFLFQYNDAMEREKTKKQPDEAVKTMYRKLQNATEFITWDKHGNVERRYNARLESTRDPSVNLEINSSTGKVNVGPLGMFYNSYAARVSCDNINSLDTKSELLTKPYMGLRGGATTNKGSFIKFKDPTWRFTDFDQPRNGNASSLVDSARMIFGANIRRKLNNESTDMAVLMAANLRSRHIEAFKRLEDMTKRVRGEKRPGTKAKPKLNAKWTFDVSLENVNEDDATETATPRKETAAERRQRLVDNGCVAMIATAKLIRNIAKKTEDSEKLVAIETLQDFWTQEAEDIVENMKEATSCSKKSSKKKNQGRITMTRNFSDSMMMQTQ